MKLPLLMKKKNEFDVRVKDLKEIDVKSEREKMDEMQLGVHKVQTESAGLEKEYQKEDMLMKLVYQMLLKQLQNQN